MELNGKVIMVGQVRTGTSRSGNQWQMREFAVETNEQYPKKVCFRLFGEAVDKYQLQLNDNVLVKFDIESREYNGRWYTDINAWFVGTPSAQQNANNNQQHELPY